MADENHRNTKILEQEESEEIFPSSIHSINVYWALTLSQGTGMALELQQGPKKQSFLPAGSVVHSRKLLSEYCFFVHFNKTILPLWNNEHTFFPYNHSWSVCVLTFLKTSSCLTDIYGENIYFPVYGWLC